MKRIDFFTLARPVQERFVESTRGQGVPVPLLVARMPLPLAAIGWGALSAAAVLVWIAAVRLGYAKLESPLALQPAWLLVLEIGSLLTAVLLGLQSRRSLRKRWRLPFVPTVYLFPVGAVDARSQNLVLHGFDELTKVDANASRARVSFAHGSFSFPLADASQGAELKERAEEYRQKLAGSPAEKDLVMMDPLRDNGFKNPFSPADSMRPPRPARLPLLALSLLAGAALLAFGVYELRNHLGERAIYEHAVAANGIDGYRAYLARGGKRPEVSELFLPRAELRAAVAQNSVEAIEKYIADHPNSKIDGEIQTALRNALLRALEDAKQQGSITALREFEAKYQKHLKLVPELPGARVAYLGSVLDHFQKTAKPSKELWLMARRLIVYADKHGPKVAIRFAQQDSHTLEKNEHMLTASAYYGGDKTLPSHLMIGEPAHAAEQRAGNDIANALGKAFPSDLVHFELGPSVDPKAPPPRFTEPTVFVTYRLEISNPLSSKKPRGIYSTVGLVANASFSIPDKEPPAELKYTAWHAPDIRRLEAGDLLPENVYTELIAKAWSRFTTKYTAPWLGQ
ncbi:MAG TPA: hypothetical protein VGQ57_17220 [Polyangiaceae bacterium]|nr:hypothetical protein [Polyangiaceae bacterium]